MHLLLVLVLLPKPLVTTRSVLGFHKIRELKINGTVDGGKDGTLQYVSLFSQIKLGEAGHNTAAEIIDGVITLLESNLDIEMPQFIKML